MLCEKCGKNNAEVFYSENVNGKVKKFALCHECAEKLRESGEIDFSMPSVFSDGFTGSDFIGIGSLIGSMLSPVRKTEDTLSDKRCDLCQMTFSDFMREGKAGCPRCYETFGDELERTVAGIHGGTRHTGSVPAKFRKKKAEKERLESLRRQINEAVAAEDYERAAALRDEIRSIENGNK